MGALSVAWKTTRDGSYLLTGSGDKLVRRWQVKQEGEETKAILCWSSGHGVLNVKDALFEGVRGLSEINERLVRQRCAVGGPSSSLRGTQETIADSKFKQDV